MDPPAITAVIVVAVVFSTVYLLNASEICIPGRDESVRYSLSSLRFDIPREPTRQLCVL